jgi:sigma-E factor negative regulatory protein RseB
MPISGSARSIALPTAALSAIVLSAIALVASAAVHADEPSPQDLLRRMSVALHSVDFEGSFIYQHDGRTDSLRIFHQGGERERERLISLGGSRGEIVRDGAAVVCVQSDGVTTLFTNRAGSHLLPLVPNVRELGAQYGVTIVGEDRVAGYDARIVDIAPRDPYRYGYRLWLQKDNQLLLRSAVYDAARRPLEQLMFVALDVGTRPNETDLSPSNNVAGAVSPDDEIPITSKPAWIIASPPAGFRLVRAQTSAGPQQAEHLVYSDGIASVSVYVEPHVAAAPVAVESAMMRGVLSIHSLDAAGARVTALGDVPPATVQAMARGVKSSTAAR